MDYNDEDLNLLLSDVLSYPDYYLFDTLLFNGNPDRPYNYIEEIKERYPNYEIHSHKDLIDIIIIRMRDDRWTHFGSGSITCDFKNPFTGSPVLDFECLMKIKQGGDFVVSMFIYALLQSHNVPSRIIEEYLGGHPGIDYVTENLTMQGNNIEELNSLPPCIASSKNLRRDMLNYLELYDDPIHNSDLIYAYNYQENGSYLRLILHANPPEIYRNEGSIFCQSENSSEETFYLPPLSEEEIAVWLDIINIYLKCGDNILQSQYEQCDDGNLVNGDGCSSTCQIETQCSSGADTIIADGVISQDELNSYIQEYYIGNVDIDGLSNAIAEHLNGCG